MTIPNLLIVAGTGTKSGKTAIICKIISKFSNLDIIAIKITPHFHETTDGLKSLEEENGYAIYEETNKSTSKDTSRMLNSGAAKVYFAKVWDENLTDVFFKIMKLIPGGSPIICESPALRNFIEPGLFIIMTSDSINKHKNINHLVELPHLKFKLEELEKISELSIKFENGSWVHML